MSRPYLVVTCRFTRFPYVSPQGILVSIVLSPRVLKPYYPIVLLRDVLVLTPPPSVL
jgi:hypothetical protein